jgi:hypothetical protein
MAFKGNYMFRFKMLPLNSTTEFVSIFNYLKSGIYCQDENLVNNEVRET